MKTSMRKEGIAGITTFLTMSYIVIINPSILSTEGTGMPFNGVMTATVTLCFLMTLFMGIYAKIPFAVGPGMGLNAFFTYAIVLGKQIPWPTALGMVFWSGVLFLLISATPIRLWIAQAIPSTIRTASAVGIGLFLTLIGLKNAGFVIADPATFVTFAPLHLESALAIIGFAIMAWLMNRKSPLAFIFGIAFVTLTAWLCGRISLPDHFFQWPDFHSVFMKMDLTASLSWSLLPPILTIFLTDLFDSISTLVGVSEATGMLDKKGQPLRLKEGLIVDAFATLGGGVLGTSPGTAFIESSAGIEVGGRTGKTSIVTALCFLPCYFIAPLVAVVPEYATAPVLILVGALMFKSVSSLRFKNYEEYIPAFLTIVLIPLTFSITTGILWGFIAHVCLFSVAGRFKEIHPMMLFLSVISIGMLCL